MRQQGCRWNILGNKDRWILKPSDSYGSDSVADGKGRTQEEWKEVVARTYEKDFICQEYATQYTTENIEFAFQESTFGPYINMSGLYSYNGTFTGIYSRQAAGTIIASHASERNVVSYVLRGRR